MRGDHLLHEAAIDRVAALGRGSDERVQRELVDGRGLPWLAWKIFRQASSVSSVGSTICALQMEVGIVARVLEREGTQRVRVGDARAQRLERRQAECVRDLLGAGKQDAEALLGVEVVRGEPAKRVEDGDGESLGVVDEDQGMGPVGLLVPGEVLTGRVEVSVAIRKRRNLTRLRFPDVVAGAA